MLTCSIGGLFGAYWLLLAYCSIRQFPNNDELGHLPAAYAAVRYGEFGFYRVNPPLSRFVAGLPLLFSNPGYSFLAFDPSVGRRPEFTIGEGELRTRKLDIASMFVVPRLFCTVFPLLGMAALLWWVWQTYSTDWQILVLAILWCFSPNLLAAGASIVPDACAVAFGIVAGYGCWRYLHDANIRTAAAAGVALGLALLSKLTWITALVSLPLTAAVCIAVFRRQMPERPISKRVLDLTVYWSMALLTLNAGYLFEGSFEPLGKYEFCSEMLGGKGNNTLAVGNRFENTWLANLPVPVPRNYVLGIDYLRMEVERKAYSFLNGQWKFGSWPHYYVFTTLYKTPEPTLLGALIGLGVLISGIRRRMVRPEVISMFLFLIIPAGVCFASVSLQGGFNHHHRYVLMIYPPMFALVAYIASPVGQRLLRFRFPFWGARKRSIAVPLAVVLVTLSALSSLRVHPYYTSYFNTLSGGPENGWRLLGFSNIDWGQDILEVDRWLKENPDKRPVVIDLDYFLRGQLFDVGASTAPVLPKGASIDQVRREIDQTQWWIISVTKLYNLPGERGLEYLQQIEPVERIAYAYHVYRIDPLPK